MTLSDAWEEGKLKYTKKFCQDRSIEYKRRFASGEAVCPWKGKPSWNRTIIDSIINQYDSSGKFVRRWDNLDEIGKNVKTDISLIINCIKGNQRKSGGFIWKLAKNVL